MERKYTRKLILENGREYLGYAFGGDGDRVAELVYNTAMMGYQEIISDPSYADQAVLMTYPLIGGYGITDEDLETKTIAPGAIIVSEYNDKPSNFQSIMTLAEVLTENNIPGIEILDTRELARHIRDEGSCRVLITDNVDMTAEEGKKIIAATPVRHDAVERIGARKRRFYHTPDHKYNVAVIDCGLKPCVIHDLNKLGCNLVVMPHTTTAEEILALGRDGLFISDGPGDPQDVSVVIELIRALRGKMPIFGMGLGHQLIALAYGAKTYAMKQGHRGCNHPVKNLLTGTIDTVMQNHGYTVDTASLENTRLELTHVNVIDGTVEGIRCAEDRVLSVQFTPGTTKGPNNSETLYDTFITLMKEVKTNA